MSLPRQPGRMTRASSARKSERQRPKLSFTYTAGMPASLARILSARMARAAASARSSMASAPSKSKALIMSMMRSATRASSPASARRPALLARERGIERRRERGLAAHQRFPGELQAFALALGHELQSLGADGE